MLRYQVVGGPVNGTLSGTAPNLLYQPLTNYFGLDWIDFQAIEVATSATARVSINVRAVNDAPTFNLVSNLVTVLEDSVAFRCTGFATNISKGASNESSQTVSFAVTTANTSLFSLLPALTSAGSLSFTPAKNAYGTTVVSVVLHDSGGTANGGKDTSAQTNFTIAIVNVDDPPVLVKTAGSSIMYEDGVTNFDFTVSDIDNDPATLTLTVSASNTNLFPASSFTVTSPTATTRHVVVRPAQDQNGSAQLVFTLDDHSGWKKSLTATLTVIAVNDAPFFRLVDGPLVITNKGVVVTTNVVVEASKGPANESAQVLAYTVVNSSASLFYSTPTISAAGLMTLRPKPGMYGTATLSVTVKDSGGTANGGTNTFGPLALGLPCALL